VVILMFVFLFGIGSCEEYYVSNGGSDEWNGLYETHQGGDNGPWASLGEVSRYRKVVGFGTGDDVYLECGGRWTGASIYVDWAGIPGDRVVIGAYEGSEKECVSGDKPIIDGNYLSPTKYTGLVQVQRQSYVTVENLRLVNSFGQGVRFYSGADNGIVRNVDVEYTGNAGIQWYKSSDGLAEDCTISLTGMGWYLGYGKSEDYDPSKTYYKGDYVNYELPSDKRKGSYRCAKSGSGISGIAPDDPVYGYDGSGADYWDSEYYWPFAIGAVSDCDNVTIRGCEIYKNYGEGIGFYLEADNCVAEDNVVYESSKAGIYIDGGQGTIVRNNLVYGTTDPEFHRGNGETMGPCLWVSDEGIVTPRSRDNVFYNNFAAYCSLGIDIGTSRRGAEFANSHAYDNVVVGCNVQMYLTGSSFSDSSIYDNIFWAVDGKSLYEGPSSSNGLEWRNNQWSDKPGSPPYDESDVIGAPDLRKKTGWRSLTAGSLSRSDFDVGGEPIEDCSSLGGSCCGAGQSCVGEVISVDDCSGVCCGGECEDSGVSSEGICEGMELLMHFDGDAVDSSGNGRDGEVIGAVGVSEGRFGGTYRFDGTDDILIGESGMLAGVGEFSVSGWIYPEAQLGTAGIVEYYEGDSELEMAIEMRTDNKIKSAIVKDNGWGSVTSGDVGSGWTHFVVVYDGVEMRIYLDGELDASSEATGNLQDNDRPVHIGMNPASDGVGFVGMIDEVGVWDRALSVSEVVSLSSGVVSCECVVVGLGDVSAKILDWKAGVVGIDAVLDVVEAWKGGC